VDSRRVLSKVGGMDVDVMVEVKAAGAQLPPKRFFISLSVHLAGLQTRRPHSNYCVWDKRFDSVMRLKEMIQILGLLPPAFLDPVLLVHHDPSTRLDTALGVLDLLNTLAAEEPEDAADKGHSPAPRFRPSAVVEPDALGRPGLFDGGLVVRPPLDPDDRSGRRLNARVCGQPGVVVEGRRSGVGQPVERVGAD
jgi:hypothetical protein